jgi:hypothetical protein
MRKAVWLMVVFLGFTCFGLWRGARIAESTLWERYLTAGDRLRARGRTEEAARRYQAAIRRAERFGPADPRLAISLHRYAALLHAAGQDAAAAPLEARAEAIQPTHDEAAPGGVQKKRRPAEPGAASSIRKD